MKRMKATTILVEPQYRFAVIPICYEPVRKRHHILRNTLLIFGGGLILSCLFSIL